MQNFFPLGRVNADVYIGTGAGKRLLDDIRNAKEEIQVVSPFLTPDFIDLLVDKAKNGVKVMLITNDMNKSRADVTGHGKIVHKILTQERVVDEKAVERRKKGRIIGTIWLIINVLVTVGLAITYWRSKNTLFPSNWHTYAILCCSLLLSYLVGIAYLKKVNRIRIYQYKYFHAMNFKIFKNKHFGDIHSKIYCLDNKKAYLGSLNFTKNGFEHFFETCITISDQQAVSKISQTITDLFRDTERECYDDDELEDIYYRWSEKPY